ncbi:MAG: hypothetical protein WCZ87_13400, partial [Thiohalobacteraceae bacterium]
MVRRYADAPYALSVIGAWTRSWCVAAPTHPTHCRSSVPGPGHGASLRRRALRTVGHRCLDPVMVRRCADAPYALSVIGAWTRS